MPTAIYKYPLNFLSRRATRCEVQMPRDAQILTMELQHGTPCIWARVDPTQEMVTRTFVMYGTGHPINDGALEYVGTFQLEGGNFVFHVFEAQ